MNCHMIRQTFAPFGSIVAPFNGTFKWSILLVNCHVIFDKPGVTATIRTLCALVPPSDTNCIGILEANLDVTADMSRTVESISTVRAFMSSLTVHIVYLFMCHQVSPAVFSFIVTARKSTSPGLDGSWVTLGSWLPRLLDSWDARMKHFFMFLYILFPFGPVWTELACKGPLFIVFDRVLTVMLTSVCTVGTLRALESLVVLKPMNLLMGFKTSFVVEDSRTVRTLNFCRPILLVYMFLVDDKLLGMGGSVVTPWIRTSIRLSGKRVRIVTDCMLF